jgi:hypothetical protein
MRRLRYNITGQVEKQSKEIKPINVFGLIKENNLSGSWQRADVAWRVEDPPPVHLAILPVPHSG